MALPGTDAGLGRGRGLHPGDPKDFTTDCAGVSIAGVTCQHGTTSAGLEIDASLPLSFSGNTASGSRQFTLPYGDVTGDDIDVHCDELRRSADEHVPAGQASM